MQRTKIRSTRSFNCFKLVYNFLFNIASWKYIGIIVDEIRISMKYHLKVVHFVSLKLLSLRFYKVNKDWDFRRGRNNKFCKI